MGGRERRWLCSGQERKALDGWLLFYLLEIGEEYLILSLGASVRSLDFHFHFVVAVSKTRARNPKSVFAERAKVQQQQ